MSSFHEIQFPPDISSGAAGGPAYSTTVVAMVSGHEKRNINWSQARGTWNVAHGLKTRDQVAQLIAFFRARKGKAYGFRFKDWTDYQGIVQPLGTGDGTTRTFPLVKRYASGGETDKRRPFLKDSTLARHAAKAERGLGRLLAIMHDMWRATFYAGFPLTQICAWDAQQ